ncbi:sodium:alanine symporter, partial [Bacillus toyonensis]
NLIAITLLSKVAFAALQDYINQKKAGKDPIFYKENIKGLENIECWDSYEKTSKKKSV